MTFRLQRVRKMGAGGSSAVTHCVQTMVVRFTGSDKLAQEADPEAWRHNGLMPLPLAVSTRRRLSNQKAPSGGGQEAKACKSFMRVAQDWTFG